MLQFYKVLQIFVKFPSQLYIQSLMGYFPPSFIRTIRRYSFQFSNSRRAGIISRGCNSYPNRNNFGKCDRAHSSDFRDLLMTLQAVDMELHETKVNEGL